MKDKTKIAKENIEILTGMIELCKNSLSADVLNVLSRCPDNPMKPAQLLKEVNKISKEKVSMEVLSKTIERLKNLGLLVIIPREKRQVEEKKEGGIYPRTKSREYCFGLL